MKMYKKVDEKFIQSPYRIHKRRLSVKLAVTAISMLTLAFLEHSLFLLNCAYNLYANVKTKGIEVDEPLTYFLKDQFGFIFEVVPFSLPMAFFVEAMNMSFTFAWNFMETFVMLISLSLSTRFEQVNDRIRKFHGRVRK